MNKQEIAETVQGLCIILIVAAAIMAIVYALLLWVGGMV
jgi:hypothetical protein